MSYTQPAPPPPETQRILDLERELTELSAHINAANFRLLELIAEFDAMVGWGLYGCMSCAHWLNWQCGIGMNAAREKVRVARALESLPKITEEFRCGRLSYSKVRAMTRAATPENEAYFVEVGRLGTAAHVEKLARAYRGVVRELTSDEANRRYRKRYLEWYHDDDGSVVISARLTPEDGAVVIKALDQAREALWHEQREERQRAMERKAAGNNAKVGPGTPGFWPLMDYRTRQDVSAETPEDPSVWDDTRTNPGAPTRWCASPSVPFTMAPAGAQFGPLPDYRARFSGNAAPGLRHRTRRLLRARHRRTRFSGNGPAHRLRCQPGADGRRHQGRAAVHRAQVTRHSPRHAPCARLARRSLCLPGLHAPPRDAGPPHRALGRRR